MNGPRFLDPAEEIEISYENVNFLHSGSMTELVPYGDIQFDESIGDANVPQSEHTTFKCVIATTKVAEFGCFVGLDMKEPEKTKESFPLCPESQ